MATKEMKTLLIGVGTAFLSAGTALITTGKYFEGSLIVFIGIMAFYVREIMKEEAETIKDIAIIEAIKEK
jgi:uncharacterized membrane protein YjjP (DUF1212 family)